MLAKFVVHYNINIILFNFMRVVQEEL